MLDYIRVFSCGYKFASSRFDFSDTKPTHARSRWHCEDVLLRQIHLGCRAVTILREYDQDVTMDKRDAPFESSMYLALVISTHQSPRIAESSPTLGYTLDTKITPRRYPYLRPSNRTKVMILQIRKLFFHHSKLLLGSIIEAFEGCFN